MLCQGETTTTTKKKRMKVTPASGLKGGWGVEEGGFGKFCSAGIRFILINTSYEQFLCLNLDITINIQQSLMKSQIGYQ